MQKIRPFLWFNDNAEEAVNFYVSLFKNSKISDVSRYPEESPGKPGSVMTMSFELEGQEFMALNGGPHFTFSAAISFFVDCVDQAEVDDLWDRLAEGGTPSQCGWITDRFGVTWQIIPRALIDLLSGEDRDRADRAMQAMLKMVKIDVETLENA